MLPTLSRDAAVGHEASFAGLLTRALRLLDLRDGPDRRPDRGRPPAGRRDPVRGRQDPPGRPRPHRGRPSTAFLVGLTAHALIAVLARAFYARQDTVTPVVAAVGAVAINCTLAVVLVGPLGLPGIALAIAIAAWIEALALLAILYRRLPHFELRGLGRVGVEAVVGSVVAGRRAPRRPRARPRAGSGPSPGRLVLIVEAAIVSVGLRGRLRRCSRSPCGSRNCRLSSGSWPTSSAARSGRDGRRTRGLGPFVAASDPGSYLQLSGWAAGQGGQRLVGAPDLERSRRCAIRSAPRSSSADPGRCRGASPTRRAVRSPAPGTRRRSGPSPTAVRARPAGRGRPGQPRPDRPRDRGRWTARPGRRAATRRSTAPAGAPRRRSSRTRPGSSTCGADEDALWGDLRKKWRQYVNKARTGGDRGRRRRRGAPRRVLPDLPRDRGPGGLPDPRRIGLPRRVGGVRADAATPGCCSPRPRTASRRRRSSSSAAGRGSSSRTAG